MMKRLIVLLIGLSAFTTSCYRNDVAGGNGTDTPPLTTVPEGFDWKMARRMSVSVAMPTVEGVTPDYAVVRVYASATLSDDNMLAMGVLKPSSELFTATVSVPSSVRTLYVQTTLPDGRHIIRTAEVGANVSVSGADLDELYISSVALAADGEMKSNSMPQYPTLEQKTETDFATGAVIKGGDLPGSWNLGLSEYYIPEDAEVNVGGYYYIGAPKTFYVAGKLKGTSMQLNEKARLVVLPTGEIDIKTLTFGASGDYPCLYVFEGGKVKVNKLDLMAPAANEGSIEAKNITLNGGSFYNACGATVSVDERLQLMNGARLNNDGTIDADELSGTQGIYLGNFENGSLKAEDAVFHTSAEGFDQMGYAEFEEVNCNGGTWNIYCHTVVSDDVKFEGAKVTIASGAALEAGEVDMNNTKVSMGGSSMFICESFNKDSQGGRNYFVGGSTDDQTWSVVLIDDKATFKQGRDTYFDGAIEVVYDNSIPDYYGGTAVFTNGAVHRLKESESSIGINPTECNGNTQFGVPQQQPEPVNPVVPGLSYTVCFEDAWPWLGDYDMNDMVVTYSVDRTMNQSGQVESIRINWETRASGAASLLALGLQLDEVAVSQIASVESTHTLGAGPFSAVGGIEPGNDRAVIPLFNSVQEVLSGSSYYLNTTKNGAVIPTLKHVTTIVFAAPVAEEALLESHNLNFFLVVNSRKENTRERTTEIHLPGYRPTQQAIVTGYSTVSEADPYRYYVSKGDAMVNNGMMWALMIPGEFRYPVEHADVRDVYPAFNQWVTSGGISDTEWYNYPADEARIF